MEKNKLDKLILGTVPDKKRQRTELPPVRDLSDTFRRASTDECADLSTWFDKVVEKFEQYRLEFNRALTEEPLTITACDTTPGTYDLDSCNVILRVKQTSTTIGFLVKLESQSAFDLLAEFENNSESDAPSTLRFEEQDIYLRNLSDPLRRLFGFFIEAVTETFESLSSGGRSSDEVITSSSSTTQPQSYEEPDFTCAEDFVVSPLAALLGPSSKTPDDENSVLSNLLDSSANKGHLAQPIAECEDTECEDMTNQGETNMLQTKEPGLIDSLDRVRHSVEQELAECVKQGAKAFEIRDMRAIQHAATRMDKIQNLKGKIDATVDEWIRELSE